MHYLSHSLQNIISLIYFKQYNVQIVFLLFFLFDTMILMQLKLQNTRETKKLHQKFTH